MSDDQRDDTTRDLYWDAQDAQDAAFLRATRGAHFGRGCTLPSGRFMSGDEILLWQQLES